MPKPNQKSTVDAGLLQAIEAMHRAYRVLTEQPDEVLQRRELGRAHHRILYLLARHPASSVNEICELLRVTRQAANAPLRKLVRMKLVRFRKSEQDSRIKLTELTVDGAQLERQLTDSMRSQFGRAFKVAGPSAEAGWFAVMAQLVIEPAAAEVPVQRPARRKVVSSPG